MDSTLSSRTTSPVHPQPCLWTSYLWRHIASLRGRVVATTLWKFFNPNTGPPTNVGFGVCGGIHEVWCGSPWLAHSHRRWRVPRRAKWTGVCAIHCYLPLSSESSPLLFFAITPPPMSSIRPNSKSRSHGMWRVEKLVGATTPFVLVKSIVL